MKSTDGAHYIALDHIRALAALMVFVWHFVHGLTGYPVSFGFTPPLPLAPLAVLDEGHTGVALFMTLSGYLFAKLLDGKQIIFRAFLWNRALRLFPLLFVVIAVDAFQDRMQGGSAFYYLLATLRGFVSGELPNGGWSVAVECHFYLVLPLLLWMLRRARWLPMAVIATAIAFRGIVYLGEGSVQHAAYWTLFGRIDQFILGILAFHFRAVFRGRHALVAAILAGFAMFYWLFDRSGGYYGLPHSAIWIVMPTAEGFAYAAGIAWYDTSFAPRDRGFSRLLGKAGAYSYSIYLLHFYWAFDAARIVDENLMHLTNFYVATCWAIVGYLLMIPIGYLSFRLIEAPFLKLRKPYIVRGPLSAPMPPRATVALSR